MTDDPILMANSTSVVFHIIDFALNDESKGKEVKNKSAHMIRSFGG